MPQSLGCMLALVAGLCFVGSFWRPEPLVKVGGLLLALAFLLRCYPS